MQATEDWDVEPICKLCHYRRPIDNVRSTMGTYWQHTACHYILDNDVPKEGRPKGMHCPSFKAREVKQNE